MIRPAEPPDWEAVRDIRLRSLREEPDAYASEYQTEARFEPDLWKQRLATASSYLALDDDHALVGIATGIDTGNGDTYVVGMYVAPEARGSGCAHQLLDAIANLAARRQGMRLVLEVAESNIRATRCYRSYGFAGNRSTAHFRTGPKHHRDRVRVSAPRLTKDQRSSVKALMVSLCLEPRRDHCCRPTRCWMISTRNSDRSRRR